MSKKIYVTRDIPERGVGMLNEKGYQVDVSGKDGVLSKEELQAELQKAEYDGVLCLLTDNIDGEIFDAAPSAKIFANYAVGYNNIDVAEATKRGITVTNTPGVLTETVAEHAFALILAVSKRVVEADKFVRSGKYEGWAPKLFLGTDLRGKILGILGAGRIGSRVAYHGAKGFDMKVVYYDIERNSEIEEEVGAEFRKTVEEVLKEADFVSIHVPLLDSTHHLLNEERLSLMKSRAYLINTSRGPVVDEKALLKVLKEKKIRGAAIDVFENEPELTPGLSDLDNIITTPHIASATEETRQKMSEMAAENIIAFFEGKNPPNAVNMS